jgi:hypothetical protein
MSVYNALAGRIRTGLRDITVCVERVTYLKDKALRSGDDGFWDGVALNLHGFYSGVERIFEDIARTIENSLPSGAEWHSDLLTHLTHPHPSPLPKGEGTPFPLRGKGRG